MSDVTPSSPETNGNRTTGNRMAVRSMSAAFQLECRYCGWGDHNTDWHDAELERLDENR